MASDQKSGSSDYHVSTRSEDYMRRRRQVQEEMEIENDTMYASDGYYDNHSDGYYDNHEMLYSEETRDQAQRKEVFSDEFYYV